VIVSVHVAAGGLAGALVGSRRGACAIGLLLHVVADAIPHRDFRSRTFELGSGVAGVLTLAFARGFGDPATVGAIASSLPDFEHVLPLPRPGGRRIFPSHRWSALHRAGGVSAGTQLAVSVAALAMLVVRR
jgi:hypothetical protein